MLYAVQCSTDPGWREALKPMRPSHFERPSCRCPPLRECGVTAGFYWRERITTENRLALRCVQLVLCDVSFQPVMYGRERRVSSPKSQGGTKGDPGCSLIRSSLRNIVDDRASTPPPKTVTSDLTPRIRIMVRRDNRRLSGGRWQGR